MRRVYAIGDIHGMYNMLLDALAYIDKDCEGEALVMFCGDYVDRGPQSAQVIRRLRDGPMNKKHEWVCLQGNHDEMMWRELRNGERMGWSENYGRPTIESYNGDKAQLIDDCEWLRKLPRFHHLADEKLFFVHAGLRPHVPLEEQSEHDMLWERDEYRFLTGKYHFGFTVVHGHTPRPYPETIYAPGIEIPRRIGIDTGACFGRGHSEEYGYLTIARWCQPGIQKRPDFIRVDGVKYPTLFTR